METSSDPHERIRSLVDLATAYHSFGATDDELDVLNHLIPLVCQYAHPSRHFSPIMMRAHCLMDLRRFEEALDDCNHALLLLPENAPLEKFILVFEWRSDCFEALRRFDKALVDRYRVLQLLGPDIDPEGISRHSLRSSVCLLALGRIDQAIEECSLALRLALEDSSFIAPLLMQRAICLQGSGYFEDAIGDYDDAIRFYSQELFSKHIDPTELARCMMNRATCLAELGQLEEALSVYDNVLLLFSPEIHTAEHARYAMNRANCLARLGWLEAALEGYDQSFAVEDQASTVLQDPANRVQLRQVTTSAYQTAVVLALQQGQSDRAWGYVQRGKGRTLTDLLAARAELTALDRQELLLRQQYDAGFVDDATFIATMQRIGDQRKVQHDAHLGTDPRAPMALADVVNALQPDEGFLDAFTVANDGTLHLFLLHPGQPSIAWVGQVDGAILTSLVDRWQAAHAAWRDAITSTDPVIVARRQSLVTAAAATEQDVLAELGDLVFAPVLAQLDASVTTLIVSPDGLLHRLPLAAVTLPDADGKLQPLIDRIDLQLVPTASSLAILRGPQAPRLTWPAALLAAAPFAIDGDGEPADEDPNREGDRAGLPSYAPRDLLREGVGHVPLKHSGPEIRAVADRLRTVGGPEPALYTRDQATRATVEEALRAAHILHLATHGGALKADENVMDYRIFLAGDSEIRVRELYEGMVTLKDVFLVNLSACSLGEVVLQGAEASGFVQAFLQAGAGVVLAPLWAVDDRATKELMVRFYEELTTEERPTVAHAWRRATQRLRTETKYTHPVYWAGFLPSGDAALRLIA